jgi:Predicted DNA alkylation repair enzyme
MKQTVLVAEITNIFLALRDEAQAAHLMRFFKTGPGQYGEGDRFLGIKVPVTRSHIKQYRENVTLAECDALLDSEWHEIRLAALLLMATLAKRFARQREQQCLQELVTLYDKRLERANNWDLIDMSVRDIMGAYWQCTNADSAERRRFLTTWATSGNLWRERAAMVSVNALQRMGSLDETFWLAEHFIHHRHDLMHKAVGWMLREAGKCDIGALRCFLASFHKCLPRTALRYAIEHMDQEERKKWMAK